MKLYKIRHKETGMFSTGGTRVTWKKDGGKIWTKFPGSHLALHRSSYNQYSGQPISFDQIEVVTLELVEQEAVSVADFKKEQIAKQVKRAAAEREQAAKYELENKKRRMEQLKRELVDLERETNGH